MAEPERVPDALRKPRLDAAGPLDHGGLVRALSDHFTGGLPREALPDETIAQLGETLAGDGLLRRELLALWNLLAGALAAAGYRPPSGGEITLLNLACGPCTEAAVLSAFFGQPTRKGDPREKVRFFGMDLRGQEVDKARRRYAATEDLFRRAGVPVLAETGAAARPEVEFFADDAVRLAGYRQIPRSFDIVFIRHQNVWHDRLAWRAIFEFALDHLTLPGGLLIVTSYFDREHLIALKLLKSLGAHVVLSHRNPHSRPLDYPGKSTDRHLALVRRPQTPSSL